MVPFSNLFQRAVDAAVGILYPTACRACGAMIESWRDGVACGKCWGEIRPIEPACAKCGSFLRVLPAYARADDRRCGRCEDSAFIYARACGPYQGALRENVLWMKVHPHTPPRLREMLCTAYGKLQEITPVESLIPVPLHPSRFAERTFNQAEILAKALAAETGLRVDRASLLRVKRTGKHRTGMGAIERARSLEKAFRVRAPRLVRNRALMVIDDVMTTGSTAQEAARTLMEAGAKSVSVLTAARAMNEFIQ